MAKRRGQHKPGGQTATGGVDPTGQGPGTSTRAVAEVPGITKPIKQTRFAEEEWFYIEGDELDEYTFDNTWADGSRKVCQFSKQRVGPPPRRESSIAASIWAHRRAVAWVTGGICRDLPSARTIEHDGRLPSFSVDPDDDEDFEFRLDQDILNQDVPDYTLKNLAIWDDTSVCYLDETGDGDLIMVCDSRQDGLQNLETLWPLYHHIGNVPPRPVAGASTSMARAGAAFGQRGLTWTVDSGAAVHMANEHEVKAFGAPTQPIDDFYVHGIGGPQKCDSAASIHCKELECLIKPILSECPFNLMSLHLVCKENGLCFIYLGDLGMPPYILLPGRTRAVVLKIEGNVPVYRQNDPDMQPEKVVRKFGFPMPISLIGGAAIANLCLACPAAHQQRQAEGAQPAVEGASTVQQVGEVVGDEIITHPLAPAPPAAGGPDEPPSEIFGPLNQKDTIDLKKEALSTQHLLRHKPFNRYCEDCCKSKMAAK